MAEYIEQEALLDCLNKRLKNPDVISWLCSIIAEAPTADVVEVVHGRCDWCQPGEERCGTCVMFFDYHEDGGSDRCASSACDEKCAYYKPMYACPNCGARMDGD